MAGLPHPLDPPMEKYIPREYPGSAYDRLTLVWGPRIINLALYLGESPTLPMHILDN